MVPRRRVFFSRFKTQVSNAIAKNQRIAPDDMNEGQIRNDQEYCIAVGEAATAFKIDKYRSPKPQGIDKKLHAWISKIEVSYDENWDDISEISSSKIGDMARRGTSAILAYAIHYRLHAEFEYAQYAKDLDKKVFGSPYEKEFLRPVFEDDRKTLPATFKADIELPSTYQYERKEFQEAKEALLPDAEQSAKVAVTASVYGTGGYGKTALAGELCLDKDIQAAFPGGIYWLQFGLINSEAEKDKQQAYTANDAIGQMLRDAKYPPESLQSIDLTNDKDAVKSLVAALPHEPLLIIADDLWRQAEAHALSDLPEYVSLLATTRVRALRSRFSVEIEIEQLTDDASYHLIISDLDDLTDAPLTLLQRERLRAVSDSFHGWPLLLQLANSVFKFRLKEATPIETILVEFETFTTLEGVTGWDVPQPSEVEKEKRRKFVSYCIEAGLAALPDGSYSDALYALGVFPEDTDIPFSVVADYWQEFIVDRDNKNKPKNGVLISSIKAGTIRSKLNDLSYFQDYRPTAEVLRIHDVFLAYFRGAASPEPLKNLHGHLVASIKAHCPGCWEELPADRKYGWMHLLYHLEAQGMYDEADDLRTNYAWLKGKLVAVGVMELQRSFLPSPKRADARDVSKAVNLSIPVLREYPRALAHQLYGRLGHSGNIRLIDCADSARSDDWFWPKPVRPHLPKIGIEQLRLERHSRAVVNAVFDPTGQRVLTISQDGLAYMWSADTGNEILCYEGHKPLRPNDFQWNSDGIHYAEFDPTGDRVLSIGEDGIVHIWCSYTGNEISKFGSISEGYRMASFMSAGSRLLLETSAGKASIWSTASEDKLLEIDVGFKPATAKVSAISNDFLLILSSTGLACIFSTDMLQEVQRIEYWPGAIKNTAFSQDGLRFLTFSNDCIMRIWATETHEIVNEFEVHRKSLRVAVFDPSGKLVLTLSEGEVSIWRVCDGRRIVHFNCQKGEIYSAEFNWDSTKVLTTNSSNDLGLRVEARIWCAQTGEELRHLKGHNHMINSAVWAPKGDRVLTASHDGTARIWSSKYEKKSSADEPSLGEVFGLTTDARETKLLVTYRRKLVQLRTLKTGDIVQNFFGTSPIAKAVFSPCGSYILYAGDDDSVCLWSLEERTEVQKHMGSGTVLSVKFCPAGKAIVATYLDGRVRLWSIAEAREVFDFRHGYDPVRLAKFDFTGDRLLTASDDGTVRIWSMENGEATGHFDALIGQCYTADFHPSGNQILTGSDVTGVRLWSVRTGLETHKYTRGGRVFSAKFDQRGDRVLFSAEPRTVKIVLTETGDEICRLNCEHGVRTRATFLPCGDLVAAVSEDRTLRVFVAGTGEVVAKVHFDQAITCLHSTSNRIIVGDLYGAVNEFDAT